MKTRLLSCIVLAVLASTGPAQVRRFGGMRPIRRFQNVLPILLRAIKAQPSLRYTGTYTTEFKQGANRVRHQEIITRDGVWYRIDFPNDSQFAGQVIVENQTTRLHYYPITNEIMQQPPRHGEAWERVANLANNKKFVLRSAPGEMIAGYRTEQLEVSDIQGNLVQRLFIEPGSGVIMKRQLFDLVGTQIGFFEFSQIDMNAKVDASTFVIKRKNAKIVTPMLQLERIAKRRGFPFRYLPPSSGFLLEGSSFRNFAGVEGLVETYLNGKVRLWIYLLKAPIDPERLRNAGGKNLHVYSFEAGGETTVLMGNVDDPALIRFASMMTVGTSAIGH